MEDHPMPNADDVFDPDEGLPVAVLAEAEDMFGDDVELVDSDESDSHSRNAARRRRILRLDEDTDEDMPAAALPEMVGEAAQPRAVQVGRPLRAAVAAAAALPPQAVVQGLDPPELGDDVDANNDMNNARQIQRIRRGARPGLRLRHRHAHDMDPGSDDEEGNNEEGNDHPLLVRYANLRGRTADSISSYLFDMIREGHTCTSVLGGWSRRLEGGCNRVVEHCSSHQDEAFYIGVNGRTALHEACLRGSCSHVIRSLLAANAIGATDRDHQGNTPLHLLFVDHSNQRSAIHAHEEIDAIVTELLAVNPVFLAVASNLEGSNALHMACAAPEAMVSPNSLIQLIQAGPVCANQTNNKNQTALRLHCQRRNASAGVAKILYDANPEAIFVLDAEDGWAPLHYAASNANYPLIKCLVEANPEVATVRTRKGETALHLLCKQSLEAAQLPAVDLLLQANRDAVIQRDSPNLFTPLHLVCQAGSRVSLDVVKRLLRANPEVAQTIDAEHYLPLHHACEKGCEAPVIAALLEGYPSAAHAMTRKQDSALSLACTSNRSVEAVQILIKSNPDALVKKNDYGFAPLHCVCRAYQPRMGIVQALLDACPSCVKLKTHGGETPVHLACSNSGAFVGVLQLLTMTQNSLQRSEEAETDVVMAERPMTNKVGNTPLHDACFRGSPFEHIETLAMANSEWIMVRNNAGYSPLQILCKNGRIDERIVTTFSRIGGPEIFSVIDSSGNTPLHSAMREDMDLATIKCLIRALPDALHLKTIYGDSPLHLACFRRANPMVVREVALASSNGHLSPVLETNTAGQTPIGIAMEEFRSICRARARFCCVVSEYRYEQQRVFHVLATLVKILYYGPSYQDHQQLSLVRACVALHRQGVRLDPAFIRRAIHVYPEEARVQDPEGNYPLHIEASVPIEKMSLLDGTDGCCGGECHKRMGVLRKLLDVFPGATEARNRFGHFPLNLMIQNGRLWGHEVALALRAFPPALHWHKGLDDRILSYILEKVSKECGVDTLFSLLNSRPDIFRRRIPQGPSAATT